MGDQTPPAVDQLTINDAAQKSQFSQRVLIKTILSRPDGGAGLAGQTVKVGSWVKTGREANKGEFAFLELNDGSCPANLQVIVNATVAPLGQFVPTGTCVHVEGQLHVPPEGNSKQRIELKVQKVIDVGVVDPATYPLPKTRLTLEFFTDYVHIRPRTNTCCGCNVFHKLVDNLNLFREMKCYVNPSFNYRDPKGDVSFTYLDMDDDNNDIFPLI